MSPHLPSDPESSASKWIALKRYENPGAEYFDRFLTDFRERQRSELLRLSVGTLVRDRLRTWMDGIPWGLRLALPGGAVVMALAAGAVLLRQGSEPTGQASREVVPSDRTALAEASLIREF